MFFGAVLFWGAFCLMRPSNMNQRKCQMLRGTCAETRRRRSCPTNFCWQPSSCSSSLWRNHPRDLHLTCWIYARVFQQPSRRSHSFGPKKTRRNWKAAWEHTWHHLTSPDIASIPKSWGFTVLPRVSFQITQQSCKMFFNVFHTIRYLITCVGCQTMWGTSALTELPKMFRAIGQERLSWPIAVAGVCTEHRSFAQPFFHLPNAWHKRPRYEVLKSASPALAAKHGLAEFQVRWVLMFLLHVEFQFLQGCWGLAARRGAGQSKNYTLLQRWERILLHVDECLW